MKWHSRISIALIAAFVAVACSSAPSVDDSAIQPTEKAGEIAADAQPSEPVHLRLLAFNDFHGALEGPSGNIMVDGESIEAGGVEYLAAHIDAERQDVEHTTVVAAGDLIGASPLVSSLFHDEPTIEALNLAGLDISSVGNHEFDQGVQELLRIDAGGCHPEQGCSGDTEFEGTQFKYLAANVRWRDSGETIMEPYKIREYGDLRVAYVGMTLENTPQVVVPSAIEDVTFHNEVETVEGLLPELEEQQVNAIVVVVHEGGSAGSEIRDIGDCPDVTGPVVTMAEEMPEQVVAIVSGHSHIPYICEFNDRLVTQAASSGRIVTVIDLHIDPETGEVVEQQARQRPVTSDIEADEDVAELVATYVERAEPRANRVVGQITADLPRGPRSEAGESPIGHLIADAQLAATADEAGAQIAFMNPGGIRDALSFESGEESREDGSVTYAQLHTIQPFANILTTMTLTGEQLHQLLEQQWQDDSRPHLLAVSTGFSYEWNPEAPRGERVDPKSITLDGETIDPQQNYRITVNNFMADGGDGFTVLTEGTDRVGGIVDLEALSNYIETHSPIEPSDDTRARRLD